MRRGQPTAGEAAVRVEVLGPLRLLVDGRPVDVPGPRRRAVLALLARAQGRVVTTDDLLAALWPAQPPASARAALQSHISRLRRHLGPAADRLQTVRDGYRLALARERGDALDAAQARELLAQAREQAAGDPAAAYASAGRARALWRGPALADLGEVAPLAAWSVSLAELYRAVEECHLAGMLAAGDPAEAVGPAREAVAADPLREPAVRLLMRALAATGRGADALREGYEFRRRLARQTGLDPSPELAALEREIAGAGTPVVGARPGVRISAGIGAGIGAAGRLVGRDAELAALRRLVDAERLVTVVGPGGVGKTRLALELAGQFEDPQVLLLAPVTEPAAVPYALAAALDLRAARGDVLAGCLALLAAGRRLLVVDNCEHLPAAARELVAVVVEACPSLTVLATSREPLGLAVERQFRLAPLALPDPRAALAALTGIPSVAVFLDRAGRVRAGFTAGPYELRLIGEIVRRLDGIPLAIELAAGRLSSLGLADLHARLDRALDLLGGNHTGTDPRHRTLRSTIEWSYQLLGAPEQRLFRQLSVFPDGFELATAEQVMAALAPAAATGGQAVPAPGPTDPTGPLARLVDASMVEADLEHGPRYRMLATLRAFGLDRLRAAGELATAHENLLAWAVGLAGWIGATECTAGEPRADAALRRELANLRAAWLLARRGGRFDTAVELLSGVLVAALGRDLPEVWEWALALAAEATAGTHPRRATVLGMAAVAAWQRGTLADSERLASAGLAAAGATAGRPADIEGRRWCLLAQANTALSRGRYATAIDSAVAAAQLATFPTEAYGIAALAAVYGGELDRAAHFNERLAEVAVSPTLLALRAYVAGEIDNAAGRYRPAAEHYQRALAQARCARTTFVEGIAAVGLVSVLASAGQVAEALAGYRQLIDYWERTGGWLQQWTTLRNLARLLRVLDDPEAARFLEVAADQAPDAPAVAGQNGPPAHPTPGRDAAAASRAEVLAVARRALDRHTPESRSQESRSQESRS